MSDFYLICFDIADERRLRQVAIQLENIGVRVQHSIFECHLNRDQIRSVQQKIAAIIDEEEDHVRYYKLCGKDRAAIVIYGPGKLTKPEDFYLS